MQLGATGCENFQFY